MITGVGKSSSEPLPSQERLGALKVTICPEVISCATPRPATINISVATKGWILRMATSTPFHSPASTPLPIAASSTTGRLCPATVIDAAVAPAMAMMAPTERSIPPVAITSVMPIASSATGAARLRMSMGLPNSRPSCRTIWKKCGATRLSATSTRISASSCGIPVGQLMRRFGWPVCGRDRGITLYSLCRNGIHDRRNRQLRERDLCHLLAVAHDDHPIGIADQLLQLGGDHQQR